MLSIPLPNVVVLRGLPVLLACAAPLVAEAQEAQEAGPAGPANVPPGGMNRDRQLQVGIIAAYTPAFLGSDDYQLMVVPAIQLNYDSIHFSMQDGLNFDLIRSGGLRAGPLIAFRPERQEDGDNIFKIAGDRTNALLGLGDVDATADAGGYIAYERGPIAARLDVRQAVSGDAGLIATLGVRYTAMIPAEGRRAPAAIISVGPRLTIVDDKYNQTYFGVTAEQSIRSGLPAYSPDGGLLSAGFGAAAIVPLTSRVSAMLLAGYDRLSDDAARSPLVEERGSRDQATIGLGLTYRFGL